MFSQSVEIFWEKLSASWCGHFHEAKIAETRQKIWIRRTEIRECITRCLHYGHLGCSHPQARNHEWFISDRDKLLTLIENSKLDKSRKDFYRDSVLRIYKYFVSLDRFMAAFSSKRKLPKPLINWIFEVDEIIWLILLGTIYSTEIFHSVIQQVQESLFPYFFDLINDFEKEALAVS